jgi:hypothetical protein
MPPALQRTNDDVVYDKPEFYFIFSRDFAVMRSLIDADRVPPILNLSLRCCNHLVRQHKDVKPSALIW